MFFIEILSNYLQTILGIFVLFNAFCTVHPNMTMKFKNVDIFYTFCVIFYTFCVISYTFCVIFYTFCVIFYTFCVILYTFCGKCIFVCIFADDFCRRQPSRRDAVHLTITECLYSIQTTTIMTAIK